jgi:teichuronic acid biosynthesis glycosyltransferase TuaC
MMSTDVLPADPLRVVFLQGLIRNGGEERPSPFIAAQEESLRRAGVEVLSFYITGKHFLKYPRSTRRFREFVQTSKAHLVHSHFVYNAAVALCQLRVPTVVSFLGGDVFVSQIVSKGAPMRAFATYALTQLVATLSTQVIVKSDLMRDRIWRKSHVHVVPNGVDLCRFRPMPRDEARRALGLDPEATYILFPSNAERPEKDYALAAASFDVAKQRVPDGRLILLDGIPHQNVPLYLNAVDALLFTSKSEGSPNVIKEALACNLPIVSVDVADVDATIGDARNCCVIHSRSAVAIGEKLADIVLRHERSNGAERAKALDSDLVAQRLLQIYRRALS